MYSDPMRSIPDVSGFYELGGADMSDIGYGCLKKLTIGNDTENQPLSDTGLIFC